jgi:hypothetical protein
VNRSKKAIARHERRFAAAFSAPDFAALIAALRKLSGAA